MMKKVYLLLATILATGTVFGQNFTEVTPSPFEDVSRGGSAFADVDGDNDLDIFITGNVVVNSNQADTVLLYKNDGAGNYTVVTGNPFVGLYKPAFDVADVDGDNDVDILITGTVNGTRTAKLYLNDGTGQYTEVPSTVFDAVEKGTVDFADVDNDGDQDVFLTGRNDSYDDIAKLYLNDGAGTFTWQTGTPFTATDNGVVDFADVDGNGSPDLFVNGNLYINDGAANFTQQTPAPFTFINDGDVAFADVDNDGDLDAVISGAEPGNTQPIYTELYLNDGTGNFTLQTGTPFTNLRYSSVDFSDFNGDSNPDLYISGLDINGDRHAEFFMNDGTGNFSLAPNQPTQQFSTGSISFGDVDGDMDEDLLFTGLYEAQGPISTYIARITRLYKVCNLELNQPTLSPITATCSLDAPQTPEATDNCSGGSATITATTSTTFPITDTSITEIVWNYDNGNGLTQMQTQAINWQEIDTSVTVNQETITANYTGNGVTYQWINCSSNQLVMGETNASFTPTQSGSYAVIVSQNGCDATSSCRTINLASLEELSSENIVVYPNPSQGNVSVDLGELQGELEITIYSSIGKKVYAETVNPTSKQMTLSCSQLEEGAYTINIKNTTQQVNARLLIVK